MMNNEMTTAMSPESIQEKFNMAENQHRLAPRGSDERLAALQTMCRCARVGSPEIWRRFARVLVCIKTPSSRRLGAYYLNRAANAGDVYAMWAIIRDNWLHNRELSKMWIRKAARAGFCNELHMLADYLYIDVADDDTEDKALVQHIFATVPHRSASYTFSYAYLLAESDIAKACRVIAIALKQYEPAARRDTLVALCDSDVEAFRSLARDWLLRMARTGDAEVQCQLGSAFFYGQQGFGKDWRLARHWWKLSADKGCVQAMFNLALMYEHGEGGRRSYKKAFQYCKQSADGGYLRGVTNLGYCYYWGIGTPRDFSAAVECFRRAIQLGDETVAVHNLAERYYYGEGVEQDFAKAIHYHEIAASHQYPDSICRLGYMNLHGEGMIENGYKGRLLLQRARKLGSIEAIYEFGRCYEFGIGYSTKWYRAEILYQKASDAGYKPATVALARLRRKMARKGML